MPLDAAEGALSKNSGLVSQSSREMPDQLPNTSTRDATPIANASGMFETFVKPCPSC